MRPAPRRSRWVHRPRMRARLYSSWASSTWSLPSAECAWSAKMSRMIAVRSITGTSSAASRLRSWRGASSSSQATRLAPERLISRAQLVELAAAEVAVRVGLGPHLDQLAGGRDAGRAQELLELGERVASRRRPAAGRRRSRARAGARGGCAPLPRDPRSRSSALRFRRRHSLRSSVRARWRGRRASVRVASKRLRRDEDGGTHRGWGGVGAAGERRSGACRVDQLRRARDEPRARRRRPDQRGRDRPRRGRGSSTSQPRTSAEATSPCSATTGMPTSPSPPPAPRTPAALLTTSPARTSMATSTRISSSPIRSPTTSPS